VASLLACVFGFGLLGTGLLETARAQTVPKSLDEGGTDAAMRARKNTWTLGVAGGLRSGTYMTYATELAQVLDDGDNLRILPIVTYGAASNLDDLLYLRNVDIAVTQSDVFDYFRNHRKISNLQYRVNYIVRLPVSEVQILARSDIKSIEDLRGKKVNFGPAGSGSSLTEIPPNSGLHFVPIPFSKTFADYYALGELSHKDYPTLVPEGQPVDTIAVPTVLAVFNWAKGTDRYRRVERFVEALFTKWDKFREPPRHPKWRDVNLAATVPGWNRSSLAEEMLKRIRPKEVADAQAERGEFAAFLKNKGSATANLTDEQRETLFREFVRWRDKQRADR
jgi:hypothetical protein